MVCSRKRKGFVATARFVLFIYLSIHLHQRWSGLAQGWLGSAQGFSMHWLLYSIMWCSDTYHFCESTNFSLSARASAILEALTMVYLLAVSNRLTLCVQLYIYQSIQYNDHKVYVKTSFHNERNKSRSLLINFNN